MNNEAKCDWCGKKPEIDGQKLCRACNEANYQEPDFERLLELKNDAEAVKREGFGNEWSL